MEQNKDLVASDKVLSSDNCDAPLPPSATDGKDVEQKTVGKIISDAIALHELNPKVVEKKLDFLTGTLQRVMNDDFYTNSIPVVLFKNLLLSLHIPFSKIEPAMLPTFRLMQSKETPKTIKKKPHGYLLWENEEAVIKYTNHLKELMLNSDKNPQGSDTTGVEKSVEAGNQSSPTEQEWKESEAVEFAEWALEKGYIICSDKKWRFQDSLLEAFPEGSEHIAYTTSQLYKIFKQSTK